MATNTPNSSAGAQRNAREMEKIARTEARSRLPLIAYEEEESFVENAKNMTVRGGMLLFWLVAGLAVAKDIIDIFTSLLDLLGTGLTATAVGSVVGIPLLFFSEALDKASGLIIDLTVVAYFNYIGGAFAFRLMVISIGAIIDLFPVVDVLPLTTVSFFAAYLLGRGMKKAAETAGGKTGKTVTAVLGNGQKLVKHI